MQLVLMTFGMLFVILRLISNLGNDNKGDPLKKYGGGVPALTEKYCDEELEKKWFDIISAEENYLSNWEMIENAYKENYWSIMESSERDRVIWEKLIESKGRPLGDYSYTFCEEHGLNKGKTAFEMIYRVTQRRAMYCMMMLHEGKMPKSCVQDLYDWLYVFPNKPTHLMSFDCKEWESFIRS